MLLGELRRIAQVIAVGVGDEQQIDFPELAEVLVFLRRLWILGEEGIDHDYLAVIKASRPLR